MENFTPFSALAGGVLIGLAAVMMMALNGRIAGISGILGGALTGDATGARGWQLAFIGGLMAGPLLVWLIKPDVVPLSLDSSWPLVIGGGLIVGLGVKLGSGCTSGHGVCGLSRLSPRSLAATLCFMALGMATATLLRPFLVGVL